MNPTPPISDKASPLAEAQKFDWAFDPLDPAGNVFIRCNEISFAMTKTLFNAQRMCKMLNEADLLNRVAEAARVYLEAFPEDDRIDAADKLGDAIEALKQFRAEGGK